MVRVRVGLTCKKYRSDHGLVFFASGQNRIRVRDFVCRVGSGLSKNLDRFSMSSYHNRLLLFLDNSLTHCLCFGHKKQWQRRSCWRNMKVMSPTRRKCLAVTSLRTSSLAWPLLPIRFSFYHHLCSHIFSFVYIYILTNYDLGICSFLLSYCRF